jgi:hypothetical protein
MSLQNRVDPWGNIQAVEAKGYYLGNRGIIHNSQKEIVTTHKIQGWVTCKLNYKNRKREIMSQGKYTELFFLDEATAFSAGHRPCAEYRRDRYNEFKNKWLLMNRSLIDNTNPLIKDIDKVIHRERINRKKKVTYNESLNRLPDGTFVEINSNAYLIRDRKLFQWSFDGYELSDIQISPDEAIVLTPYSYVQMFFGGFVPEVHEIFESK